MKIIFLPEKAKDYYKYMFFYWIAIWIILFLISTLLMLPKISKSGYTFRQDICLEYATSGRFDESSKCIDFGKPIYLPVGKVLIDNFKSYGLWSGFWVLVIGLFLRRGQKIQEVKEKAGNNYEVGNDYEFINNTGGKELVALGYNDTVKCDIYWEDIIASKNNKNDIINAEGESIIDSSLDFDPSEAANIINKACPFCGGDVDRFYFISNEKRESEYTGWMEVCFKCKKPIYFKIDAIDEFRI